MSSEQFITSSSAVNDRPRQGPPAPRAGGARDAPDQPAGEGPVIPSSCRSGHLVIQGSTAFAPAAQQIAEAYTSVWTRPGTCTAARPQGRPDALRAGAAPYSGRSRKRRASCSSCARSTSSSRSAMSGCMCLRRAELNGSHSTRVAERLSGGGAAGAAGLQSPQCAPVAGVAVSKMCTRCRRRRPVSHALSAAGTSSWRSDTGNGGIPAGSE